MDRTRKVVQDLLSFHIPEHDDESEDQGTVEDMIDDPKIWQEELLDLPRVENLSDALTKATKSGFSCVYTQNAKDVCHLSIQRSSGPRKLKAQTMQKAFIVQKISVNPTERGKGVATSIITNLQTFAASEGRGLLIQSITSPYIIKICKKQGFYDLEDGSYGAPLI